MAQRDGRHGRPVTAALSYDNQPHRQSYSNSVTVEVPEPSDWGWIDTDWNSRSPRDRHTASDITQDIVIAECEFDEVSHNHPHDVAGATLDPFNPNAPLSSYTAPRTRRDGKGRHRLQAPPTALRGGRTALMAVATGAAIAAAAGQITQGSDTTETVNTAKMVPVTAQEGDSGIVESASASNSRNMHDFTDQLAEGKAVANAKAAADAASRRPLFESPIPLGAYAFTSCFCNRWGSFHGGMDFAAPLGTPIHAVTDGVVREAGPASGYGNWVQIEAPDGTITMYGHMASIGVLVHKGQHVTAGDVIALVGSEGFSTGPHCHFEVWVRGMKIDPAPWLAAHGVKLANYTG